MMNVLNLRRTLSPRYIFFGPLPPFVTECVGNLASLNIGEEGGGGLERTEEGGVRSER